VPISRDISNPYAPDSQISECAGLIMVIDDDPTVRLAAEDLLTQDGFQVICISSPEFLTSSLETHHPDAFLVDVNLPFMSGYQVCEYLRHDAGLEYVPVMLMTSCDDIGSMHQAYNAGATDFISKPINYLLLAYRMRYMLRNFLGYRQFTQQQTSLLQAQYLAKLGYWVLDIHKHSVEIEAFSAQILGYFHGNLPTTCEELLIHVSAEDMSRVKNAFQNLILHQKHFSLEHKIIDTNGDERFLHHEAELVYFNGAKYPRAIGAIQDITERKKSENKMYQLAYYDQLTNLPNRELLRNIWHTTHQSIAIICLNINQFSRINDSYGQEIGDELIRRVANRLNRGVKSSKNSQYYVQFIEHDSQSSQYPVLGNTRADGVSRIESNSFVFFIKNWHNQALFQTICEEIDQLLQLPFTIQGTSIYLSASIGVAVPDENLNTFTQVMDAAFTAVNHAKKQSDHRFSFFSSDISTLARERIELEKDLRASMRDGDFFLVYQPKVDLKTGNISGFESLIRWEHPVRGLVSPIDFISLAEEIGLIEEIGHWVLQQVCIDIKKLDILNFENYTVALNVSARQFSSGHFTDYVSKTIQAAGIEANRLELEITESIIMSNVEHALKMLHTLKDIGVSIALDDFGTGYSSFSYLRRFPFDTLKIDREFLIDIVESSDAVAIVDSIISLSRGLNMESVAEGLETQEQLAILQSLQCDQGQGYLLSAPKPLDQIIHIVKQSHWREHFKVRNTNTIQHFKTAD